MAEIVYLLCALMSVLCASLLIRSWVRSRARLLLWSTLCFVGLAINNVLLCVDRILVPEIDLAPPRTITALFSVTILVIALIWERR
ncbi:MAG: DUF5985 family protein [Myxococcota bacterium]